MPYAIRAIEFHNVLQEYLLEVSSVWASFTPFWQFWAFFIKCLLSAVGKWDIFLVVKHSQIEPSRAPSLLIWAIGGLNKNGHDMMAILYKHEWIWVCHKKSVQRTNAFPHTFSRIRAVFELFGKNKNCFYLQKEKVIRNTIGLKSKHAKRKSGKNIFFVV